MDASQEIKILQSLKGDTYFAQVFKPETIDAMCENIRRDFMIDCGIDVFENCHSAMKARSEALTNKGLLDEANGTIESLREQKSEMTDLIIQLLYAGNNPSTDQEAEKFLDTYIGRKEIIKHKIKLGLKLSDLDEKWLYNNL
mgnify:CR=1 FL=1